MADPNDNLGVGGGIPPASPLGGASLEAEEKAMRKGKGRMLVGMVVAVVAAIALLIGFMASGGEDETYSTFGQNINGLKEAHFDQFWACALRGVNLADVRDNAALQSQIHVRAGQGGARYAAQVREQCMEKLAELRPKLDALIPPEDMRADVNALAEASSQLRSAWANFIAYLEADEGYSEETATEPITNIARAWYDWKRLHGAINTKLRERLGR